MYRQLILDTETTGLRIEEGHRLVEIACVEMIDRKLTGNYFHHYLNPQREIDEGAFAVHGITNHFLQDKPVFSNIAEDFLTYITHSELIIHNAPFDLAFLNYELTSIHQNVSITDVCKVIDTLQMARQLHVGQRNSLDALCKRYGIDNSKRDLHGALLDAHLLAQVYLAMTGGQGSFFDAFSEHQLNNKPARFITKKDDKTYKMILLKANNDELVEHENYLKHMQENHPCLWLED